MRFTLKASRSRSSHHINFFPEAQHPDLPLPNPSRRSPRPKEPEQSSSSSSHRHTPVDHRFTSSYSGDRRSIAIEPGFEPPAPYSPDDIQQPSPQLNGGLTRSQTVLRSEGARRSDGSEAEALPEELWSTELHHAPASHELDEAELEEAYDDVYAHMSQQAHGKTSSDSGQSASLDRWSQRRLQRLNTEQGFREQRQAGPPVLSPTLSEQQGSFNSSPYSQQQQQQEATPQQYQAQPQSLPSQLPAYQSSRTSHTAAGLAQTSSVSSSSRSQNYSTLETPPHQHLHYSSPDPAAAQYMPAEQSRPTLAQSRSYSYNSQQQQQYQHDEQSMSSSNNGGMSAPPKNLRHPGSNNRQSFHNGLTSRDGNSGLGVASQNGGQQPGGGGGHSYSASLVHAGSQGQAGGGNSQQQQKAGEGVGRGTPQPTSEDMSEEEISQLIKDHKELREKYTKVKKYYFEKEDQVKQLQNSLAHQRLSQSRTSLDDSEYTTRFNRLDGLVAQLAFSIRKCWRSTPPWLSAAVNKEAVATGKQEMIAVGRAFISCWLVSEVFDKYFHPDLDPSVSTQLKSIQKNIRRFAPATQTAEEDEYLISKIVNWRLSTLEGLQDALRSPSCPTTRANLTDKLKEDLISALSVHLQDPPPSDLEGGVHMIIELVVSIAIHLPLESRDVQIDYFLPGYSIVHEQMKIETGIPALTTSVADDAAEQSSLRSSHSDVADDPNNSNAHGDAPSKRRSVLSAITGTRQQQKPGEQPLQKRGGGSSSSLNNNGRPDSSHGLKDQQLPRVRMAAGIGVQIRGRSVLVKAPVFATSS